MDSNGGLGKLLPKAIAAKRRRKKNQQHSDASGDEQGPRGRSPASSHHTLDSDAASGLSFSIAEETEAMAASQSTPIADPDWESSSARPGAVSTHPSQIGYLTTSSPIVQEEHLKNSPSPSQSQTDILSRSATIPASRTDSIDSASSSFSRSKTGLAAPQDKSEHRRSASPASRFREVFRPSGGSSGTGSPSPERRPGSSAAAPKRPEPPRPSTAEPTAVSADTPQSAQSAKSSSAERFRRLSRGQTIDTTKRPETPPSNEKSAPVIVNTPPTPTDHNNPVGSLGKRPASVGADAPGTALPAKPRDPPPVFGNMNAQRRVRSGSGSAGPSKLSNITLAPLSPTPESGPNAASAASFFSSMFSAAQNAANTLSNSITNTNLAPANNAARARGLSEGAHTGTSNSPRVEVEPFPGSSDQGMDNKEPAVRTLGKGDLSLSQLGIAEPSSNNNTPLAAKFPNSTDSRGRSESAPAESQPQSSGVSAEYQYDEPQQSAASRSQYDLIGGAERTTPVGSVYDDSGIHRSGSVRSGAGKNHRKRGSSTATGGTSGTSATIAAAIAAANASVAHPSAMQSTTKLTGFAVASKKRNRDFHMLFKTVPDDDYLIEDYSCALQREILAHGRLYVSEGHLCFSSNILGWTTTLVMSFDEIVAVEKRSTALVFKNGLMISTLHAKHVFASFTSRDSTYDLIVKIWKLGHPSLQSSLNGVNIDEMGGDKTEKIAAEEGAGGDGGAGSIASQSLSGSEDESEDDEDDVYDEDEEEEADGPDAALLPESRAAETEADKAISRRPSGAVNGNGPSAEKPKEASAAGGGAAGGDDFPGPATHAPTECGDTDTHFDKFLADDIVPAPLGKVFNMTFGPASVTWMTKWLTGEQKCFEFQMEDQKGLGADNTTRTYSYIKPLYASLGPKQTKCIVSEHVDAIDLEKAVNITCTTQTPDVPSGNVFNVKTRYCLTWGENNTTRVQVNCTTEWTGKSWLKGPIEKGVIDGQTQYCKDFFAALKAAVSSRSRAGTNGAAGKGKKKGRKGKAAAASSPTSDVEGRSSKAAANQDWGMLEPIHGIVGPVVDIVKPLMTGNVVYGLLVGLLVVTWFGGFNGSSGPSSRHYGADLGYLGYPDRVAAYEEMWRREESELWEWLEERVGMERLGGEGGAARSAPPPQKRSASAPAESSRGVEEKLRAARSDDREIREAIKVTEEKLKALKATMEKRNGGSGGQSQ
ncbi:hypothetical protein RB594_006859 [Gaeumannomyces avenae]